MTDLNQINTALERLFCEGHRIVFWNDPDREFMNALPFLLLDGVTVLRLDEVGSLEAKIRLERDEPTAKFLLYSPCEEPDFEDDWLLDIRLFSRSFRADRPSILLQELKLVNQHLRLHIAKRGSPAACGTGCKPRPAPSMLRTYRPSPPAGRPAIGAP